MICSRAGVWIFCLLSSLNYCPERKILVQFENFTWLWITTCWSLVHPSWPAYTMLSSVCIWTMHVVNSSCPILQLVWSSGRSFVTWECIGSNAGRNLVCYTNLIEQKTDWKTYHLLFQTEHGVHIRWSESFTNISRLKKMKPTYFQILFQASLTCVNNGRHWILHAGIGPVPGN